MTGASFPARLPASPRTRAGVTTRRVLVSPKVYCLFTVPERGVLSASPVVAEPPTGLAGAAAAARRLRFRNVPYGLVTEAASALTCEAHARRAGLEVSGRAGGGRGLLLVLVLVLGSTCPCGLFGR